MTEQEIRLDWYKAFQKKDTWSSSTIGWAFSQQDLFVLCDLHEAGLFQQEILDLLEDCNFHTECGLMDEGKYDECRKVIVDDLKEG